MLTAIEGKWFRDSNVSVRDVLRPLVDVWALDGRNQGEGVVHYEMFTTEESFKAAMRYAFSHGRPKVIYVAAHGDEGHLYGYHDEGLSRAKIKNSIPEGEDAQATQRGIVFGACSFVSMRNAQYILGSPRVSWVAGYQKNVDWSNSMLLEAFFLENLLSPRLDWRSYKRPETFHEALKLAVRRVKEAMPGLATELGFSVVVRKRGEGGFRDLMSQEPDEE